MKTIGNVHHIHIYVRDIDKAVEFFGKLLGEEFPPVEVWESLGMKGTTSPSGVQLTASTAPGGWIDQFIEKKGEGLAGIAFKVPDIDEAIKEMEALGVRMVLRHGKEAEFHPKDAFGIMIQIGEDGSPGYQD